jgi:hypothetical protein
MSVLFFFCIPLAWAIFAKALGWSIAAGCFYSETGLRAGQQLSRWGVPFAPLVVLLALLMGLDGDAGHGVTLFGSVTLVELVFSIPAYAIPVLLAFAALIYVVRDLTIGHLKPAEMSS